MTASRTRGQVGLQSELALIKIDCEGCEEWFLAAAAPLIQVWRPVILIEIFGDAVRQQNGSFPVAPVGPPHFLTFLALCRPRQLAPQNNACFANLPDLLTRLR
eukprot:COSAG02_NODE_8082_length_2719_cov_3.547328_2_plen_103_part_00